MVYFGPLRMTLVYENLVVDATEIIAYNRIMKIVINTATTENCIALIAGDGIVEIKKWEHQKQNAHLLIDQISELLAKKKISWKDCDDIAVVTGPGPFTAVRVGVAAANALAYANECLVTAYNTFEFLGGSHILIKASKNAAFFYDGKSVEMINNDEIGQITAECITDLYPHQKELVQKVTTWNLESCLTQLAKKAGEKMVEPTYFRDPQISQSNNPLSLVS